MSDAVDRVQLVHKLPTRSRGRACIVLTHEYDGQKGWAAQLTRRTSSEHIDLLDLIGHATDIFGETREGLSGSAIAKECSSFAVKYNVDIPYADYPFPKNVPNKRTALSKNNYTFAPDQQYTVLHNLCDHPHVKDNQNVRELKATLVSRYGHLSQDDEAEDIDLDLVEQTRHWLSAYPESYKLFTEGLSKYRGRVFQRNLLDYFRLSFECLCKSLLCNGKSLENQLPHIGDYVKEHGGSKEVRNMFKKLLEYYGSYQNTYVKHADAVIEPEIKIIVEMTCSMMKYLLQIEHIRNEGIGHG